MNSFDSGFYEEWIIRFRLNEADIMEQTQDKEKPNDKPETELVEFNMNKGYILVKTSDKNVMKKIEDMIGGEK